MKRKHFALILCTMGVLIIFGAVSLSVSMKAAPSSFSDNDLIAKTKELREVQFFLAKYPNATAVVQRTASEIFVWHYASKPELNSKPYLYIFIIMNEPNLRLEQISLICSDGSAYVDPATNGYYHNQTITNDDEVLPYLENGTEKICMGR